jgi:multiple sugar transport system substrate-binding protein
VDLTDLNQEATKRFGEQVELCRKSSFNPTTNKFYSYAPAWVPDPGDYRKSLWDQVGLPNGPTTWDELLQGGSDIKSKMGIQMGIGMSQEIDSNMAGRALLWSFGAAEQDENENVIINSPETVAAVEYMTKLYKGAMTDEIFSWNAASNNQALIAGKASYILNSISAYRTAQTTNPQVAQDVLFSKALKGPSDGLVAQHVMYNWIVPNYSKSVDAAKEFLLNYTHNFARVTFESELYDLPAFAKLTPQRDDWLSNDPFGSKPADKLSVLKDALTWSKNVGYRGPASAATGEVFATFIVPNMFAEAARGQSSAQEAVEKAESQMKPIFDKWRQKGFIGGGS